MPVLHFHIQGWLLIKTRTHIQHNHITSLSTLLQTIRKPYLSLSDPPPLSRRHNRPGTSTIATGSGRDAEDEEDLRRWEGSKWLSDRERDEIDLRGRMILRRCRELVGELERAEKGEC
jgi:syntaxin 18